MKNTGRTRFRSCLLILLTASLSIPLALAYNGWYGGWGGPTLEQFFGSEWAQFALVFLLFFGLLFWTLGKTIENKGASAVIAGALALFASFALVRTAYFYGYFGTFIPNIVLAGLVLFILVFLLNILAKRVSPIAVPIVLFLLWLLLRNTSPYEILPYEFLSYTTVNWYNALAGVWGIVLVIIISVIVIGLKPMQKAAEKSISIPFRVEERKTD